MNVGGIIKTVLPWIGAAATGNYGALATMAFSEISKHTGASVSNPEEAEAAVLGATPEQIIALKQSDNDFKAKMQQMGFAHSEDLEKISADDRANARARQISLKDRIPAVLAIGITIGFFGLLIEMMRVAPPEGTKDLLNIMLGSLGTAWVSVVSYYFGSSAAHDALTSGK